MHKAATTGNEKTGLSVVPLRDVSAADIAAQFRRMADEIDSGEISHIESMVAVAEIDGGIQLFGWGNIDGMRATGMLSLGMTKLTSETLDWMET
jgi:hypothetical protein